MSNIRDISSKITSLKNMQKVTRAMNLISSIKLRKYLSMQGPAAKFLDETEVMRRQVYSCIHDSAHPVVRGYADHTKAHLVLFSADKGLCGTHNSSLFKAADVFYEKLRAQDTAMEVTCLGNKAAAHARYQGWEIIQAEAMHEKTLTPAVLAGLGDVIYERFLSGTVGEVWVIGKLFRSTLQQDTDLRQLLPLPPNSDMKVVPAPIAAEPDGEELALAYGRVYLQDTLRGLQVHSFLSEHSSRLTAMENATRNSEDMISKYITIQNHARQAAVTNELIEIVSGKEALKG